MSLVWPVVKRGSREKQVRRLIVLVLNYLTCIQGVPMRAIDVDQEEEEKLKANIMEQMRVLMNVRN